MQSEDSGDDTGAASCPNCSRSTEHEVLRRISRGSGDDVLAKCVECGEVHTIVIRPPKAVQVNTTLSDGKESKSRSIEVDVDEIITIGDVFERDGALWEVTRIDGGSSRPYDSLGASDIRAMWAVRRDRAVVKLTLTDGEDSVASSIECEPERVFTCGSILEVDGRRWRIRALHTGNGRTLSGSRTAGDLKRMYLHPPRARY
ncbi:MAG: HVO_0476 family zinc finger protein [Candidatus Thalassarchaeum sp.]